jgi:DNA-binding protein YbaB
MFDKMKSAGSTMKKMAEMKKQMGQMQKELGKISASVTDGDVTITVDGNMDVTDVILAENPDMKKLPKSIKRAFKKVSSAVKQKSSGQMASLTKGMGLDLPGF